MLMLFIMRWWIVDAVPEITNFRPKCFAFIMLSYLTFETAIVKTKLLLHFFLIYMAIFTRYSNAQSWHVFWKVGKYGILSHPLPEIHQKTNFWKVGKYGILSHPLPEIHQKTNFSWCFQKALKETNAMKWVKSHVIFSYLFCYLFK